MKITICYTDLSCYTWNSEDPKIFFDNFQIKSAQWIVGQDPDSLDPQLHGAITVTDGFWVKSVLHMGVNSPPAPFKMQA